MLYKGGSMSLSKQDFVIADIMVICKHNGADLDESYPNDYMRGRQDLAKLIQTLLINNKTLEEYNEPRNK